MKRHGLAQAASDAHEIEFDRVYARWDASAPAFDHSKVRAINTLGMRRRYIEHELDVAEYRKHYADGYGKCWFAADKEASTAKHDSALDYIETFRADYQRRYEACGMTAANEESERLTDVLLAAIVELRAIPAPHLDALAWKVTDLRDLASDAQIDAVLADIARLAAGGAS